MSGSGVKGVRVMGVLLDVRTMARAARVVAAASVLMLLLGCEQTPPLPTEPSPAPPPAATSRTLAVTVTPPEAAVVLEPDGGAAIAAVEGVLTVPLTVTGGGHLCASADGYVPQCARVTLPLEAGSLPPPIVLVAKPRIDGCARPTVYETLVCARALYQGLLSHENRGALMNLVAWLHRESGWGLHLKPVGNRCPMPVTGLDVSCDLLVDGAGRVYDVLIDEQQVPDRGISPKGVINTPTNFVPPVEPPCAPCP